MQRTIESLMTILRANIHRELMGFLMTSTARAPERFQKWYWYGSGQIRGPKGLGGVESWKGQPAPLAISYIVLA